MNVTATINDTLGRNPKWYNPPASYPSPICLPELCSCITKDLLSKVTDQFNVLVNWLKEIKLKGQLGIKRTDFRFKDRDKMAWPTPFEDVLEPFPRVIKWYFSWNEMVENKELLPEMWSEALESITHELWPSMDWEMQTVDVLGAWDDYAKLLDLRRRYSWYSSSVNLESVVSAWETLAVLAGNPCKV